MFSLLQSQSDRLYAVLRVVAGFLFMQHGLQKIFGILGGRAQPLASLAGAAGIVELAAGVLIAAGLFTRPAAFVASGQMAFAYFLRHADQDFWPIVNRGELAALYCFLFLYIAARGAGPLSVDRARGVRR